jgi:hypothetical protein
MQPEGIKDENSEEKASSLSSDTKKVTINFEEKK